MRGRKPLPSGVKLLRGQKQINHNEPQPEHVAPECPEHLDEAAREEWARLTEELVPLGLLTRCDRAALAAYCQVWSRWRTAELALAKDGTVVRSPNGYPILNPYLAVSNGALELMRKFLIEFGLTPSARSRISVQKNDAPKSVLQAFLAEKP